MGEEREKTSGNQNHASHGEVHGQDKTGTRGGPESDSSNLSGGQQEPVETTETQIGEGVTDLSLDEAREMIQRLSEERDQLQDKFLRAAAEMENVRRRADRERSDLIKYGLESFIKDLLPVLDSLEQAVPASLGRGDEGPPSDGSYYEGMVMVKKQLYDALAKHGFEPVKAAGEPFDPNIHQAIQTVPTEDLKEETVGEEYARGYLLNGRLIRPAMVSVLTPAREGGGS